MEGAVSRGSSYLSRKNAGSHLSGCQMRRDKCSDRCCLYGGQWRVMEHRAILIAKIPITAAFIDICICIAASSTMEWVPIGRQAPCVSMICPVSKDRNSDKVNSYMICHLTCPSLPSIQSLYHTSSLQVHCSAVNI